jgi:hypothetical protein
MGKGDIRVVNLNNRHQQKVKSHNRSAPTCKWGGMSIEFA